MPQRKAMSSGKRIKKKETTYEDGEDNDEVGGDYVRDVVSRGDQLRAVKGGDQQNDDCGVQNSVCRKGNLESSKGLACVLVTTCIECSSISASKHQR